MSLFSEGFMFLEPCNSCRLWQLLTGTPLRSVSNSFSWRIEQMRSHIPGWGNICLAVEHFSHTKLIWVHCTSVYSKWGLIPHWEMYLFFLPLSFLVCPSSEPYSVFSIHVPQSQNVDIWLSGNLLFFEICDKTFVWLFIFNANFVSSVKTPIFRSIFHHCRPNHLRLFFVGETSWTVWLQKLARRSKAVSQSDQIFRFS